MNSYIPSVYGRAVEARTRFCRHSRSFGYVQLLRGYFLTACYSNKSLSSALLGAASVR
ncbi:hypothetical protein BV20DRAFT_966605 [Pilatotrama ljubarskyi]|nr:hypothetical protein BV20DRAFT_966605 [Pilatotrama ljubarskyi]